MNDGYEGSRRAARKEPKGTSEQVPRGARWREMRMNARRTKPPVQRRLMRAQRALSREAAAVATKVVVRTTTEEAGVAGAAFSRQPFGTGLAGALALSLGSQISRDIRFAVLRAIIPGKRTRRARAGLVQRFPKVFL